uniref:coiled-coil domain-containing protein 78-like n=1 Tax=Myxine glutinosa TaxID=7769 RepID=UPI00358F39C4
MECIKTRYTRHQNKLAEKLISTDKERQEVQERVKDLKRKMAEQATAVLVSKSQQKELQAENSKLQLRLKELSEDYRARLVRCLHDLTEHVDLSAQVEVKKSGKKLDCGKDDADRVRKLLEEMINEIRSTYKAREEQLARAVRSYKKRMHNVVVQHQQLLTAYRLARDQVLALGPAGSDPGPPEACFILCDGDRQDALAQGLMELQRDKARLGAELAVMRDQLKRHRCQVTAKRN